MATLRVYWDFKSENPKKLFYKKLIVSVYSPNSLQFLGKCL